MKNPKYEWLNRKQRGYHRSHPWRLSQGGLFVPHSYAETKPDSLSWWDDVGFILNGRRIIVWWQHPRYVYEQTIEELSWQEAGDGPDNDWLSDGGTKNYRKVGASRKKVVSYTMRPASPEQKQHSELLRNIRGRLSVKGIDLEVSPSWNRQSLTWAKGVSLIVPLEVRNREELAMVAVLARKLLLGQTTLAKEFPEYCYTRADWLREQNEIQADSVA